MLVLLPASWTSLRSRLELRAVADRLEPQVGQKVELHAYKDWHLLMYKTCGDYKSWMWETVLGRDYTTRKPHFDAFLILPEPLDNAGAEIVFLALSKNRPVLGFNQGWSLLHISSIREEEDIPGGGWVACGDPFTGAQAHA